ncbi:MAG: hypothetical protein AAGJ35_10900, partial [Myxococcota bacterium]
MFIMNAPSILVCLWLLLLQTITITTVAAKKQNLASSNHTLQLEHNDTFIQALDDMPLEDSTEYVWDLIAANSKAKLHKLLSQATSPHCKAQVAH